MLSRFWESLQEKKERIKKHKTEFIVFLEKKYGKEYYNKVVSESEVKEDIDEFETYREEKLLKSNILKTNKLLKQKQKIEKETKKSKLKAEETIHKEPLKKYRLKQKQRKTTFWLVS